MGFNVLNVTLINTAPEEINEIVLDPSGQECNWTPDQIKCYVLNNLGLIRNALKGPKMTIEEILDALCSGDFNKYEDEFNNKWMKRLFS